MSERIALDPSEIATGRTEFDLTPWISAAGIDWGSAEVEAYRASGLYGDTVIDYRIPQRNVTIPLMMKTVGGTAFETVRSIIQEKAALFQREGGWLRRVTAAGTLFADVQMVGLTYSGGWMQAHRDADTEAELRLECSPDLYGNEQTLSDHVETSAAELVFTEADVPGNYPARVRVVVDEDQGQSQLGLMWGFRSRNYSSAATAALAYEAEALQPLDTATKVALSGASGGTVVTHGTLSTNWTPVLGMNLGGTAYLTHTGTYRLRCRYRTTSGTALSLRSVYDVGDLVFPEENDPWYHPAGTAGTALYIADLGELRLQQGPVGTHRWAGQIQARGAAGSENVSIDRVWFQPMDESAGVLRAPINSEPGLANYLARSEFNTESGTITGDSLAAGGTWVGAGDTDDFSASAGVATRTAVSDTARRLATAGTAATNVVAQVDFKFSAGATGGNTVLGTLARYTDSNNYLGAEVDVDTVNNTYRAFLMKKVGGSLTEIVASPVTTDPGALRLSPNTLYRMRLMVLASGMAFVWLFTPDTPAGDPFLIGSDTVLATGGTLASGTSGFQDGQFAASASTRTYDNFAAWVPTPDAVLNPSQSAELRTDGMLREDSTGTAYGPVSWVEGDLPRLPVSGLEGRTVQVLVKASRGDFGALPDPGIDDLSGRVYYRPCWLNVPGT